MLKKTEKKIQKLQKSVKHSYKRYKRLPAFSPFLKLITSFTGHYLKGIYDRVDNQHVLFNAGGLAFSLLICIIPFVLILFWILGTFLDRADVAVQVKLLIETIIPYKEYALYVEEIIFSRIAELVKYKNVAGYIGLFGLLFAASGFFSSMRTVLNQYFGLPDDTNPILSKLRDFAIVLVIILLFLISTLFLPLLDLLKDASSDITVLQFFNHPIFQNVFTFLFSLILISALFMMLYRYVPVKKLRFKSIFVGALWASLLWVIAKEIFGYYLNNIAAYGKIYGTYALAVIVAFWIYYTAIVFLVGALIAKLYSEKHYP